MDYTDLNKACPKDNFPLPRIDQLIDSTSDNQLLSFMNAYSGYNQIMMHEDDKASASFIIERDILLQSHAFGLKNAGATYQRLVNKIFKEQIGKTMEVYVDEMLVKAPQRADHIKNLAKHAPKVPHNPSMSNSVVSLDLICEKLRAQHLVF
ncbi:hypothetical protein L3X38_032213 [Prunus dulcis]|uniref:Reverse transcriptase domain-containing protein n=1 Tax=Prunus dulcis TaxID=3755 RepID=A0AAD4VEP9_PRUDU|nr:hypothetical protein L3X38_032213 [Prunus dulcis]